MSFNKSIFRTSFNYLASPMQLLWTLLCKLMLNTSEMKEKSLRIPLLYCRLVGSLIYLTTTRPHTSFVVHIVNKFIQSPRNFHLLTIYHIIRYRLGISTCDLFSLLVLYSNSKYIVMSIGLTNTRKSSTGWNIF